jgi:hypothetical protein
MTDTTSNGHRQVGIPGLPGYRCDEGIEELVGVINSKGMRTTGSCQGTPTKPAWVRVDGKGAIPFLGFFATRIYQALCKYPPEPPHRLTVESGSYGIQLRWHPDDYGMVLALAKELCDL